MRRNCSGEQQGEQVHGGKLVAIDPFAPNDAHRAVCTVISMDDCIRCDEAPAVDESGLCGHCFWAVRSEAEEGMFQLRAYLARWLEFRDWEARHA